MTREDALVLINVNYSKCTTSAKITPTGHHILSAVGLPLHHNIGVVIVHEPHANFVRSFL